MASDPGAILAFDTAAAQCAVALVSGERVLCRVERVARGHAELLFPLIDEVLDAAGVGYEALARVVCCTGPGSFVGTRIAVAAARGLALGLDRPAVGVSRFEALAAEAREAHAGAVAVLLAGRQGTVFFQGFDVGGAPLAPPRILPEAPGPDLLARFDIVAGDGVPDCCGRPHCLAEGLADPAVLARLGAARTVEAPPAPLYLRPPEADLPREGPPRLLD